MTKGSVIKKKKILRCTKSTAKQHVGDDRLESGLNNLHFAETKPFMQNFDRYVICDIDMRRHDKLIEVALKSIFSFSVKLPVLLRSRTNL